MMRRVLFILVLKSHNSSFPFITTAPVALSILTDNLSHRFLCLKTSRVLSEFTKARVNSVPTNRLSGEVEIPTGRASLSLPSRETSIPFDVPAEPLLAQASPEIQDGYHKQEPPVQAPDTLGLQQLGPAQAVPSGSASDQQSSRSVREVARAVRQGNGQQEPPEDDGSMWSLGVFSPTSPVSDTSFSGGRSWGDISELVHGVSS